MPCSDASTCSDTVPDGARVQMTAGATDEWFEMWCPGEVAGDMATAYPAMLVSFGPPMLTGYACPVTTVTGDQSATIWES